MFLGPEARARRSELQKYLRNLQGASSLLLGDEPIPQEWRAFIRDAVHAQQAITRARIDRIEATTRPATDSPRRTA